MMLNIMIISAAAHHHKRYKRPSNLFDMDYHYRDSSASQQKSSDNSQISETKNIQSGPTCQMLKLTDFESINISDLTRNDLNRALKKYDIMSSYQNFIYFITICSYNHKYNAPNRSNDRFRAAGFLNLQGSDRFINFQQIAKDENIMKNGAEFVDKEYPWLSAAFVWDSNYMKGISESSYNVTSAALKVISPVNDELIQNLYNNITDLIRQSVFESRRDVCKDSWKNSS